MHRPKVFISRRIPETGLALLQSYCDCDVWDHDEYPVTTEALWAGMGQADAAVLMLTDKVTPALLDHARSCQIIANMAVGFDNIPVDECTARQIFVTNAPVAESIGDLTMALILAMARRLVEGHRVLLSGRWRTWSPRFLIGQDVFGATLGIIGMGRIGKAVARRAKGFDMRILYNNRRPDPAVAAELGAEYTSLDDLLRQSDFVVTLAPLNKETYHLIGARELSLMKPTATLINTGRGRLIDEKALYQALIQKRIWGAGLDVFEIEPTCPYHPLLQLENVLAVPHIGSASTADRNQMSLLAAANVLAALRGERPPNLINWEVLELLTTETTKGEV
jgi:glyoxylate reductase